jgi:uncharacterized protein YlxP (DUF503 family)
LVEQRTENPRVAGSIPARGTIYFIKPFGETMFVRVISLTLFIGEAQTLKDKRQIIQSLINKLHNKLNVSVAEVGFQDQWQRSQIGIAFVSNQLSFLDTIQQEIFKLIETQYPVEITEVETNDY